jgi:DNA-binding GntR family transcriptional regulator
MAGLANKFGCSETPVREAMRRLESEGYVQFTPHAGAVVTMIDDHELSEIYLIRISLEALATRLAGPYISKSDIDWLKKKNREMKNAVGENRYEDLAHLNKGFHLRIYQAAPFPRLSKMIADLWDAFERWPSVFSYVPERGFAAVREHEQIIAALERGDIDAADDLMKEQKKQAMTALQSYLAKRNAASPEMMESLWQKQRTIEP